MERTGSPAGEDERLERAARTRATVVVDANVAFLAPPLRDLWWRIIRYAVLA
jgi:hypothetical protein